MPGRGTADRGAGARRARSTAPGTVHYVDNEVAWKVPATSRRVQDAAVPVVPQSLSCTP